ncbi:MAG TPA: MexW/MexI family multidrug efflux RND transporter permease subunit [Candidatus Sulfotelmatobacter sp.]|nr:MexW/MexI family multidrug efflux RND transporter permease subunit [Candidatus Sulfotelmatobacter sp.]
MTGFTDIFIRRPVLATVVSLLILLVGLRSLYTLPVRQYPKLDNTVISITTAYPGASAELMQGFITVPIEQAVASAEGIEYMTSSSTQGTSAISAYVRLNYDGSKALTDVMAKVQQVKYLLPKEALDPVILKTTGQGFAVMYIGFSSAELSSPAISDYLARAVQPLLATVDGVASADILGGQTFAMRLWLDPLRMAARGISADDVANAIRSNNFQSAPGQAKGMFVITNVETNTGLTDVDQFRNMVVKAQGGSLVRLRDIATVELGAQSTNSSISMNGQHAVFIGVQQTPTGNPLSLVKGVRALLPEIQRNLPPSLKMDVVYDSTKFIQSSIDEVIHTLGMAVAIVIAVIFLFLGTFRSVVIPIVTIPLSLIGSMALMLAMGFSLNLLTLLAMVLAIGLVVDDAIVVVENVYRHIEAGRTPVQAALIGAREIVGPIVAMTITLAAVYAPIGFLTGLTGALFREFAFTLAGAVIISGIVALTLSPMMCSLLLTRGMSEGGFARVIDRSFRWVTNAYGSRLDRSLEYRAATGLFAVVVLAMTAFMFLHTKRELAPDEDQGVVFAATKAPQYANLDYADVFGDQLDKVFASFPETDARFVLNGFQGVNQGFAGMILKPWDERTRSAPELKAIVQPMLNKIAGLRAFAIVPPPLPGTVGGLPVQMVIYSPGGYETVYKVMEEIKAKARASGLFIVTDSDLDFNNPVIRLTVDRSKANDLGISMQSIGDTLAVLVGENYINRFDLNGRSYEVIPQVPRTDRLNADRLTQFYVTTATGQQVPLSTVVSITTTTQPNVLSQYNQLNSATFQAVPVPGVTMGDAVSFLEKTTAELLPAGFSHAYLSDARQYVTEGNQLTITLGFALIVIFLVLAAQFESLRDPLVILVSVPMSICGALMPLFLIDGNFMGIPVPGTTINIYTQVGLVTLVGLISKHGILMVEFANQLQLREGLDRRRAIERAARVRLRPILMTTAAMVVGLIPLLLASGAGAVSRFSIGLVIVSGMSIGTLFTLFVLPAVYTVLAKDHRAAATSERVTEIAALS